MPKTIVVLMFVALSLCDSAIAAGSIRRAFRPIPGEYLILLDYALPPDRVRPVADALAQAHGGRVRRVFNSAVNGFSSELTEAQAARMASHPAVILVEENGYMELAATRSVPEPRWNLDRVDQRPAITAGDGLYRYCEDGTGGTAYVVDSGVRSDHVEFGTGGISRVKSGACMEPDCVNDGRTPCYGTTPTLDGGHGTAVASVLAGSTVGVASGASIVPVQVVNCSGVLTTEWVAWGLDWIRSFNNPHRNDRPAVVNMSLFTRYITGYLCEPTATTETSCTDDIDNDCDGFVDGDDPDCGGTCPAGDTRPNCQARFLEHVINGIVLTNYDSTRPSWEGIPVVVAAANHASQWHHTTPARMANSNTAYATPGRVISVGGTSRTDARWQCPVTTAEEPCPKIAQSDGVTFFDYGSNFGNTVDIYAPAHEIESAHITGFDHYRPANRSGTSFAAPLVAGVALRLLQAQPWLTPPQVWTSLRDTASTTATPIDPANGNNRIIYRDGSACP